MATETNRREQDVESHSVALKKPLGLFDLVLTQILFVVGSTWVGTAAKLGKAHFRNPLLFGAKIAAVTIAANAIAIAIYRGKRAAATGGIKPYSRRPSGGIRAGQPLAEGR